jgi:AcrR family transcriptional regulator
MRSPKRTSRNASRGRPRPGGRSARVRAAVFAATQELLQQRGAHGFSLVDVAERAGVAPSSLYRRWGGVEALIMDVGMDGLMQEYPLPDTGSLHGDLEGWADNIVRSLRDPVAATFFRMLVSTAGAKGEAAAHRTKAIRRRRADLAKLVERARRRGERAPDAALLVDVILAPLYTRALFGERLEAGHAQRLVARLMRLIVNQR